MEIHHEVCEKIKSFIPRDKDMKSPTSDCIKHLVLYDIHLRQFQAFPRMSFVQHAIVALRIIKSDKERNAKKSGERESQRK